MRRELSIFVALILLCFLIQWSNSVFFGVDNVSNTLRQIGMYGILAVGVMFVMVQGGIDLSVGSVVGLTGVIIAKVSSSATLGMGKPLWMGILLALTVAACIGLMQGLLITKLKLQPFIVTLGGMLLFRGVSQVIVEGGVISLGITGQSPAAALKALGNDGLMYLYNDGGASKFSIFKPDVVGTPLMPWPILMLILVLLVAGYVLHLSVFGRHLFAIGGNRDAAVYSGLPVDRCEIITYVVSSLLAGVAGCFFAGYISQMSQNVGIAYELSAIAAAVLGGISLRGGEGTVISVFVGTALMRVIENGINLFKLTFKDAEGKSYDWHLGSQYLYVVIGAVILLAVTLDQIIHEIGMRRKRAG